MSSSAEAWDLPDDPPAPLGRRAPLPLPLELLRLARPRQWVKNLLVFVAPAAAGVLFHRTVFLHAVGAFAIFCVAASGTYFLNDSIDAASDRSHPTKRWRPVAAGFVPVPLAVALGGAMLALSVVLAALLAGWHLSLVIAIYAAVNVAYSLELRNEPVVDLVAVSAGFVLRAIAGGVATGVPLSIWFLIVASFGSLLIVTGKRSGEKEMLDVHAADHGAVRQTLGTYTPTFLRSVRILSAAVTVTAYCLWAFERAAQLHPGHHPIWFQLTVLPFTMALLHLMLVLDSGVGAAPEELALTDRRLQVYGVCWAALFAIGVYGG